MPARRSRVAGALTALSLSAGLLLGGSPPHASAAQVEAGPPARDAGAAVVHLLEIDGVINPLSARYLTRGIAAAREAGAHAVVLRLDTPGGLESSMRTMSETVLGSPVPVLTFVAPSGARAASAGMFVSMAGHVAAMAPGTNIGAAHPVGLGGQADTVMTAKVVSDAAAAARAIAAARGRNAEWAELAVIESASITADEAVERNVVDLVAEDLDALLSAVDGREVEAAGEVRVLRTAGARVIERPPSFAERALTVITDPNIAYILFTLGVIGLIAELYNPGMFFPGITGAISLVLAFVAFGSLPVGWAGVLLLLLAVGLFIGELYTEGIGVLGTGGLIAFVLGSLLLYRPISPASPALPDASVSPWLIALMTLAIAAVFGIVIRALVQARRAPVATGIEALVGREGVAVTRLSPAGSVRVAGEEWSAVAEGEPVRAGETVRIVRVEGITLRVVSASRQGG